MRKFFHIVRYTVADLLHQKSFFVMLAVSIGFVLLLRGCYKGNYVVNGQAVNGVTIAWHASIIAFHVVSAGVLLIAAILSMNLFRRDREDGTTEYMLSKPVHRNTYAFGRVMGVWLVSFCFMFILHLAIFLITLLSAGGTMPGYLFASVVSSANVLFMVLLVCLFSLFMPDFAAAFVGLGVAGISYISDIVFQIMQNAMVQSALGNAYARVSVWRLAWPKVASLQYYAVSLVDKSPFHSMGPVHPFVNLLAYVSLTAVLIAVAFRKREI
jgi:ABC-type transport system involved in multi-copper enzyme maturation permease subunit